MTYNPFEEITPVKLEKNLLPDIMLKVKKEQKKRELRNTISSLAIIIFVITLNFVVLLQNQDQPVQSWLTENQTILHTYE
jgi:hypothetical protein